MQKDFITATPDSGGSGSTTVTAAASANQTESARSVSLSVAGGGMTRTVGASQAAGVVTWNYYFSVTPTSLSFVAGGESKSVTVTSYRKKVINGVETSTQENVNYTVSVTGTGFSGSGTTVTAAANSATSTRTGTATYTQATSGKTQAVSLSQAAVPRYTLTIQFRDYTGATAYLFNSSGTPLYGPNDYYSMGSGYENASIMWDNTNGLTVCKTGSKTETVKAKAGDTITVRIQQSSSNSFDPMHFSTFTLKAENQTITP